MIHTPFNQHVTQGQEIYICSKWSDHAEKHRVVKVTANQIMAVATDGYFSNWTRTFRSADADNMHLNIEEWKKSRLAHLQIVLGDLEQNIAKVKAEIAKLGSQEAKA